ncbi:hypothetical protein OH77DRAFT_1440680 [Trametes cingulata]|nr:hypothetical protein OH77DRAFT_1440680 [Trametes cingulata]
MKASRKSHRAPHIDPDASDDDSILPPQESKRIETAQGPLDVHHDTAPAKPVLPPKFCKQSVHSANTEQADESSSDEEPDDEEGPSDSEDESEDENDDLEEMEKDPRVLEKMFSGGFQ